MKPDRQDPSKGREREVWDGLGPRSYTFRLTEAVTDRYGAQILVAASQGKTTAVDVSRRWGIPIAAVYRRLRLLERAGLVVCEEGPAARNGRRTVYFWSRIESVSVAFEDGRMIACVNLRPPGAPEDGDASPESG